MPRRHHLRGTLVLLFTLTSLHAHEEWNNLHIVYSAKDTFAYPLDGRSPKVAVALLNHHEFTSPRVKFTLSVNGQAQDTARLPAFPNGGDIVVAPELYGLASVSTAGVYDGTFGPPPAVGETKTYTFEFVFSLVDPSEGEPDEEETNTVTQEVRFINLGDNPALSGPFPCSGILRFPAVLGSPPPANVRFEVATPYSNWFPLVLTAAPTAVGTGSAFSFSLGLPARDDWQVRFSADGYETRVIPLGYANDPHPPLDVTLVPAAVPDLDYRRIAAIATPTGFWRGAVSESEGTFVAFPGQEKWKTAATDAEARALRSGARLYKYKFDGTKLWEHAPGWEIWGGDMTPDGRYVAYALNPTVLPFYTPPENRLVLLDGVTGAVIWTKSAPPTDAAVGRKIESLEIALSPDDHWIAVGSMSTGTVTLVDRSTGNFVWTVPGTGEDSWGQIRKLRFSSDSQILYCGSGDDQLRKLQVSDGAVLWSVFAGGWPYVNGLDLTPDGAWLAAGTKSFDATVIRTSDGLLQWQRETQSVDSVFAPDGRHFATFGGQIYRTFDGSLAGMTKTSALTRFSPDGRFLIQLDREFRLYDLSGKILKTFEPSGIATSSGDQPQWAHLTRDGRYAIVLERDMSNPPQTGIAIYERLAALATTTAPTVSGQPLAQTVVAGTSATLAVGATGSAPISYQWRKTGSDLVGQTAATLTLTGVTAADAASYTCLVVNAAGSASTNPAALAIVAPDPRNPSRLANLAVRANVGTSPLIVGFSLGGEGTGGQKSLLIRAAGPSLGALGVTGALPDPRLTLFSGATPILSNDNWSGDAQITALAIQVGAFPFVSATSKDAAFAATAIGGSYTVQLSSGDAGSGTALAEIYDGTSTFAASTPRLVNVSARTDAGSGANVLIAGFVVAGPAAKTVLIRAIGPGLAQFGVNNALADPQLTLFRDATPLVTNDNWYEAPNAVAIASAAIQVGAFSIPPASRDAALLLSLPPGNYGAQVSGFTGSSGNALIEVYEVP